MACWQGKISFITLANVSGFRAALIVLDSPFTSLPFCENAWTAHSTVACCKPSACCSKLMACGSTPKFTSTVLAFFSARRLRPACNRSTLSVLMASARAGAFGQFLQGAVHVLQHRGLLADGRAHSAATPQ